MRIKSDKQYNKIWKEYIGEFSRRKKEYNNNNQRARCGITWRDLIYGCDEDDNEDSG